MPQRLNQPRTPPVNEQRRADVRLDIAKPLQNFAHPFTQSVFAHRNAMPSRVYCAEGANGFAVRTPHVLFLVAAQPRHEKVIRSAMEQTFKRDSRLRLNDTFEFSDELLAG
jgi:hypothetical protein